MTSAMLHVIVLLAALSGPAHQAPVFAPFEARQTIVRALPTTSDYTLQVADNGPRAWSGSAVVLDEGTPHEGHTRGTTVTGSQRPRQTEQHRTTGFAQLRFEIQRR